MDWKFKATILRVLDADTLDCRIKLGFHVEVVERLRLCMSDGVGINAPEIRGVEKPEGLVAKAALVAMIEEYCNDDECIVRTFRGTRQGKYGRFLASIENEEGIKLCDLLVEGGHAEKKVY